MASATESQGGVTSSVRASEKSVVICGWVNGDPSTGGCGNCEILPSGDTRRLSFSRPIFEDDSAFSKSESRSSDTRFFRFWYKVKSPINQVNMQEALQGIVRFMSQRIIVFFVSYESADKSGARAVELSETLLVTPPICGTDSLP